MNGLIEQWGHEDYTQDVTRITTFVIAYNSTNSFTITIGAGSSTTQGGQWNYPCTVRMRTNTSFELTSKSNLGDNARIYYRLRGY